MVMLETDKDRFCELLEGIADVFSSTKKVNVTVPMLQVYFMSLTEYSYQQVEWAIGEHLKTPIDGKFFPKPANIIEHLKIDEPSTEEKAELAWAQIMQQLRSKGSYGNLELDDKQAIATLKSFTTWKEFCMSPVSDMTWMQKKFMSMYSTYENTPLEMLPSSLPGLVELQNHKEKYAQKGVQDMKNVLDGINKHRLDNK